MRNLAPCIGLLSTILLTTLTPLFVYAQGLKLLENTLPAHTAITNFLNADISDNIKINGASSLVEYEYLRNQEGEYADFVRISVNKAGERTWDASAQTISNKQAIQQGDWVYVSFAARAAQPNEQINLKGFIERSEPSWELVADASLANGHEWRKVIALGRAQKNFEKGQIRLSLHSATQAQQIDLADPVFVSLPASVPEGVFGASKIQYAGMSNNAAWRAQAADKIRQHREGNFTLQLRQRDGGFAAKREVAISIKRLAFDLGSMTPSLIYQDSPLGEQYREWFSQFFNAATATIYWADWGWEDPDVRQQYIDKIAFFKQHKIPMRGHTLLYPAFRFSPQSLIDLADNRAAFISRVNQQIDEMVPILRAYGVNEYDVINELRDEKEWLDIVGIDTVVDWFKRVHRLHPEAILYINENSILTDGASDKAKQDHYYNLIQSLLEKSAPIHGIGMQGHFSGVLSEPEKMWQVLDRFAAFNLPIRITEYDSNTRDEAGQARFDYDFLTAMYAHPSVVGVTRWGFYAPKMWRPNGALVDKNNQLKANGKAQLDWLAKYQQFQHDAISDASGQIHFNAPYGMYEIKVSGEESVYTCNFSFMVQAPSCTLRLSD